MFIDLKRGPFKYSTTFLIFPYFYKRDVLVGVKILKRTRVIYGRISRLQKHVVVFFVSVVQTKT